MKNLFIILMLLIGLCGCSSGIKESSILGVNTYVYEDYNMPKDLGKPSLKEDRIIELADKDIDEIIESVDSYIDLLRIVDKQSYSNKLSFDDVYKWAANKFDEAGFLETAYQDDYNKMINGRMVYVLSNGYYYPLDYLRDSSAKEYFKYYTCDNALFTELDDMVKTVAVSHPLHFFTVNPVNSENIIICDNGMMLSSLISKNTKCYSYYGYSIPVGLGLPKLSKEEIIELTRSDNYELIRDSIDNIGDAIAFVRELGITQEPDYNTISMKGRTGGYGGVYYDEERGVGQSCGGPQLIDVKLAQCTAMSTLLNFLLYDDYDEFYYVGIYGSDGHCINCVKGIDGRYYLIDGSLFVVSGIEPWLARIGVDGNADTMDELLYALADTDGPWGDPITTCYAWDFDGVWTYGGQDVRKVHGDMEIRFPEGVKHVKIYEGVKSYSFYKPVIPKDHFYFLELK